MRVLITGAEGMLGSALTRTLEGEHEVMGIDIGDMDLSEASSAEKVARMGPEFVCHLAAFTDVDGCEQDPERACRSNVLATRNIALACRELECPMLYTSTDYVFDGKSSEPYGEEAVPNPLSMYGRTKLIGEWFVERHVRDRYIVRTSWLFGENGRNFVDTILALAAKTGSINVVGDQRGSPTYTRDLAGALAGMIKERKFGTYHVTNQGDCTWHELAVKAIEHSGLRCSTVRMMNSSDLGRPAPRPSYSVLDNGAYARAFGARLRPYEEALKDYVERRSGGAAYE